MKCSKCGQKAVFRIKETKKPLCEDHALSYLNNTTNPKLLLIYSDEK